MLRKTLTILSLIGLAVSALPILLLSGCLLPLLVLQLPSTTPHCDDDLGVCPPPEPGAGLNTAGFSKSVWLEEGRIGDPYDAFTVLTLAPALCEADLDLHPGPELVFKGSAGIAVIVIDAASPNILSFVPLNCPNLVQVLDLDGDGDPEYLLQYEEGHCISSIFDDTLALWAHSGTLVFRRQWRHGNIGSLLGDWTRADLNGDGIEDFAITTDSGVELISGDGTALGRLGDQLFSVVKVADVDGEGSLELVTSSLATQGGKITTWTPDGRPLASFVPLNPDSDSDEHRSSFHVVRYQNAADRDYIFVNGWPDACLVYDIDGTVIQQFAPEQTESGFCILKEFEELEEVDHSAPLLDFSPCLGPATGKDFRTEVFVRFSKDREPFRVELSHSVETTLPFIAGLASFKVLRAILEIYDEAGSLVYREVSNAGNAPGSALVIPSDVEGEELLLLADNVRILEYRLDGGSSSQ